MRSFEVIGETADGLTDPGHDRFAGEPEGDVGVIDGAGPGGDFLRHLDKSARSRRVRESRSRWTSAVPHQCDRRVGVLPA